VPLIAGDQVVGAGSVGAFQEDIVVGIARDFKDAAKVRRCNCGS
jgi:hypothetical protein